MVESLETGDIYFLYRPRVEEQEPEGPEDVQRLHIVLKPWDREPFRLVVMARKHLPEADEEAERLWGFVGEVVSTAGELRRAVGRKIYQTRTRGEREQPGDRPAAEGAYVIARHGDHTHLAYELDLPEQPSDVQQQLNIAPEVSLVVTVKNPQARSPYGQGLPSRQEADFPEGLRQQFDSYRFVPVDPVDFLDYEGAELVIIGATENAGRELGIDLDQKACRAERESILADLRARRASRKVEPLFEGEWE